MSDREIAVMAFLFSFSMVSFWWYRDARRNDLPPWLAILGAAIVTFAGVAIAYFITKVIT